jgi:hypothetical protein
VHVLFTLPNEYVYIQYTCSYRKYVIHMKNRFAFRFRFNGSVCLFRMKSLAYRCVKALILKYFIADLRTDAVDFWRPTCMPQPLGQYLFLFSFMRRNCSSLWNTFLVWAAKTTYAQCAFHMCPYLVRYHQEIVSALNKMQRFAVCGFYSGCHISIDVRWKQTCRKTFTYQTLIK